ncbi:hypothetical protein K470DRAFT_259311 [Piedraia hortae CBS 480.64]|uniref:MARVEL domain-containing protein n=1 Tax=Piedraia hortae CBS 480.64 TaxID=1314780 RepID=A0A6A7BUV9_9PEZI|nr:hypothetical protein K470DRAFT_259311 [Piedraia hortae CBS 480.64]
MALLDSVGSHSHSGGLTGAILRAILRFFQFIMALVVAGLYGQDLQHPHNADSKYGRGKWIFAEICAGLSAFTALIYGIPFVKSFWGFGWDWILFLLWTALFGMFGKMYINTHKTQAGENGKQVGHTRMKNAVWVDLVCMLLWLVTAIYSTILFFRHRSGRTLHTGRARV